MKKIKEHIVYYYYSYLLALTSIAYGWQLIVHPNILQTYRVYQKIRDVFDHRFIGVFFCGIRSVIRHCYDAKFKESKKGSTACFQLHLDVFCL